MHVLIVTEMPSFARVLAPLARAHWPQDDITFFNVVPFANIKHRYPRGLKWADCPHIGPAQSKLAGWTEWHGQPMHLDEGGDLTAADTIFPSLIQEANEVVFACDPDASGAAAFEILLSSFMPAGCLAACPSLWCPSWSQEALASALQRMRPFSEVAADALAAGRIKRYFDWNWNTNSLVVLSRTMRQVGAPADAPPMSKYALQLLYAMRGLSQPEVSDSHVVHLMAHWKGTGRYQRMGGSPSCSLGGPTSYAAILENLAAAGFVERIPRAAGADGSITQISSLGRSFLDALHPDCEDADLPFRLTAWCRTGESAKPAIDRYIRTFYGKQMRFFAH